MNNLISIFIIFLSGIGINFTPCVYPLIPITISYFGSRSLNMQGKPYIHGLVYLVGIAITNSLLAIIASVTGSMLGFILQKPAVIISISVLLFILGLNLFDLWQIKIPARITHILSRQFSGYKGSLFIGLLFGLIAAPCAAPFVIGLMIYVAKEANAVTGFLYFLVLSLGMGLPIGILATFSGMINRLPSSGEWMIWIKRLFAWILIFMSVYILRPVVGEDLQKWFMALVIFVAGIQLGFLDKSNGKRLFFAKKLTGAMLIFISFYILFLYHVQAINWMPYSESLIEEAKKDAKPVIMDFYADWCMSCVQIDKEVFNDSKVIDMSKNFIMIRIDLTHQSPYQKILLKRYAIKGLPTVIFITPRKVFKIEGEIKSNLFLQKMKQAISLSNI